MTTRAVCLFAFFCLVSSLPMKAQQRDVNYDEAKAGDYVLPDPLRMEDGTAVTSAAMWREKRRPELIKLFENEVYGRAPGRPAEMRFEEKNEDKHALGGKATRKEITIFLTKDQSGPHLDLLLYIPNGAKDPSPAFLGLNFQGNHTVHTDPGITLKKTISSASKVAELPRGNQASRWQVEKLIDRGYALATMYYGDIDPDYDDGFKNGVHPLFYKNGQARPGPEEWGSIAAWAWGLSRAMDYLEKDRAIDPKRVAVVGHSRLGKTALWAGALDERFAIVISNDSGCGGAALNKRIFGETVGTINRSFPHWFCENFKKYSNNEAALPVDAHELIALSAPRPVYVASAAEDLWADPKGEFLALKNAEAVYKLLGQGGLPADKMPGIDHPVMGKAMAYHVRTGKHDITEYDWEQYLAFADKHFRHQ